MLSPNNIRIDYLAEEILRRNYLGDFGKYARNSFDEIKDYFI